MFNKKDRKKRGGGGKVAPVVGGAVCHAEPVVVTQEDYVRVQGEGVFWPEGVAMPFVVRKVRRGLVPCPKCRRVQVADGGQVAVCTHSREDLTYFRCRECGKRWKLPVEIVE